MQPQLFSIANAWGKRDFATVAFAMTSLAIAAAPSVLALALSHLCGMLTAFVLTKVFVFARSGRSNQSELGRFAMVNVVSVVQTLIVAVVLVRIVFPRLGFHTAPELLAHAIGLAVASATSFYGHRHFSFGRK